MLFRCHDEFITTLYPVESLLYLSEILLAEIVMVGEAKRFYPIAIALYLLNKRSRRGNARH